MAAEVGPATARRRNSLEELEAVALDVLSQIKPQTATNAVGSLSGASKFGSDPRRKVGKAEVENSRPCPSCGNQVAAVYRSCRSCGERVE